MLIEPAISSARPPKITTLVLPRVDSPEVRANGTVRPSESPMVASAKSLALRRVEDGGKEASVVVDFSSIWREKSPSLFAPSNEEVMEPRSGSQAFFSQGRSA